MRESEHVRFHHIFYSLWRLALSPVPTICDILAVTDLRETLRLLNVGHHWIQTQTSNDQLAQLDALGDRGHPLFDMLQNTYEEKQARILGRIGLPLPEDAPLQLFTVFDEYQEDVCEIPETV